MRIAILSATLLAACVMSACAGGAGPVKLTCPAPGHALIDRLCAALRQELEASPPPAGKALHLTLQASSARPDLLRARLVVGDGPDRREGPEIELSVMDRATIPDSRLRPFSRLLLQQTLPPEQ